MWIGVNYHKQEVGLIHPIDDLPVNPHVTVLHLGKRVSDRAVTLALEACQLAATLPELWPCVMEITGVGWFWRKEAPALVALVNSRQLGELRSVVRNHCASALRDRYGFIPHLTLDPACGAEHAAAHLARCSALRWQVSSLQVHCGEVTIEIEHKSPW